LDRRRLLCANIALLAYDFSQVIVTLLPRKRKHD
jgi:hypothetical protein